MPRKVSELLAETATAELQIGGSAFAFVFYVFKRERFTEEEMAAWLKLPLREYLKGVLPRVVQSWDAIDDDGHAVPVTAAAIEEHKIPNALLIEMERRIFRSELSGKAANSNNSHGT